MRELLAKAGTEESQGLVGLTFDDGYENFQWAVLPVLDELGFSSTVFIPSDLLGQTNSWVEEPRMGLLAADCIRELSRRGIEIAPHGANHVELLGLDSEALKYEVEGSRRRLGDILDEDVVSFAYPYGAFDSAVVDAVRQAGYAYACTALEGVWWQSAYAVPRIFVGQHDTPLKLRLKLRAYPRYASLARMRYARSAYALVRRTPLWRHLARILWYG
jgi:peptidoglycan/xylan/chitin deacetylase (PgdA/CDA1 family)